MTYELRTPDGRKLKVEAFQQNDIELWFRQQLKENFEI